LEKAKNHKRKTTKKVEKKQKKTEKKFKKNLFIYLISSIFVA